MFTRTWGRVMTRPHCNNGAQLTVGTKLCPFQCHDTVRKMDAHAWQSPGAHACALVTSVPSLISKTGLGPPKTGGNGDTGNGGVSRASVVGPLGPAVKICTSSTKFPGLVCDGWQPTTCLLYTSPSPRD